MFPADGLAGLRLLTGLLAGAALWLASNAAWADALEIVVTGVGPAEATNIEAQLGTGYVSGAVLNTEERRRHFAARAREQAMIALRPYGWYAAQVSSELLANASGNGAEKAEAAWRLHLTVNPGPPVRIRNLTLELRGPGAEHPELLDWRRNWPLPEGARLVQPDWEAQKSELLERADAYGYLQAQFLEQRIELDLELNQADLFLIFDTGPRATLGEVRFNQDFLQPEVLAPVPRFQPGEPYRRFLVDLLRTDLWKLGYFEEVEVHEQRQLDATPARVDLEVTLTLRNPVTHQGTLGYGTDTEFRTQYRWQRYRLSERGDSATAGFAWQTFNEEIRLFGEYRLPRHTPRQQFWLLSPGYHEEVQDFELDIAGRDEPLVVGNGRVESFLMRFGRARLLNPTNSREQIIETLFAEYLDSTSDLSLNRTVLQSTDLGEFLPPVKSSTLALGIEYDWPVIFGSGFATRGHHERFWAFTSQEAWGSDRAFTQVYASSRWSIPWGDRFKLLLRGELGLTDANTRDRSVEEAGLSFDVSVTELPDEYRFKAGGSFSVRGYDFESLSNNGIGSNNLAVASAEVEFKLREKWSLAAFADLGNAYNDWDELTLNKGYGIGVRYYTVAFPVRLDVARAMDLPGQPWQLHFTLGTPLL